jgi:matrixin
LQGRALALTVDTLRSLWLLAAVAGCSARDPALVPKHDACAPLALVAATANDVQRAALDDAQALWRDRGAPALGRTADAALEVRFEPAAGAYHGLYDDEHDIIYINSTLTTSPELAVVIAHEVGHAFGLVHVTDRTSVMSPGNLTTTPTEADQQALALIWGSCR